MAQRIQRKRTAGWRMPEGAVYVGRPGPFGNPFRVGGWFLIGTPGKGGFAMLEAFEGFQDSRFTHLKTPEQAVEFYRRYVTDFPMATAKLEQLRGKDLACWCPVGSPCHADVLLEIANAD